MSIVLPKTLAERQAGIKAKRNASSIPYDMVTLQYHDSLDGERLRYHDDKVRYRAAVRSSNLLKNGGSRAGYDILTGGDVRGLEKPSYPQASAVLAEEMAAARSRALADCETHERPEVSSQEEEEISEIILTDLGEIVPRSMKRLVKGAC